METRSVEVCFSPKLFGDILTKENFIVVLADILRATTSICAAFENGVKEILPVGSLEQAKEMKSRGFLVASEQDGRKLEWADYGNSAFNFTREAVGGKTMVYCTTNGTRAIEIAKEAHKIAMGAFVNLTALSNWLVRENKNIVILCSGWKNKFCIEDSLFAGALCERLLAFQQFNTCCDSARASMDLWNIASTDLSNYLEKAAHRHRLKKLGLDDVIPYSLVMDSTRVVPVYENGVITDKG